MNIIQLSIDYKEKTATMEEIYKHLSLVSDSFEPPLSSYVQIQDYSNKLFNYSITFEAWVDNVLVGLIACYYNNELEKTGYITNVSVINKFKKKGIAKRLLELTITYGRKKQYKLIALKVRNNNLPAINLYNSMGFFQNNNSDEKGFINLIKKL